MLHSGSPERSRVRRAGGPASCRHRGAAPRVGRGRGLPASPERTSCGVFGSRRRDGLPGPALPTSRDSGGCDGTSDSRIGTPSPHGTPGASASGTLGLSNPRLIASAVRLTSVGIGRRRTIRRGGISGPWHSMDRSAGRSQGYVLSTQARVHAVGTASIRNPLGPASAHSPSEGSVTPWRGAA